MITHIMGFTGSRHGMTDAQKTIVLSLLSNFNIPEVHHGMCVGADKEFHDIVVAALPNCRIIGHPPVNISLMSDLVCDVVLPPKSYHARDRDIVRACTMLIATPNTYQCQSNSGTWYTIGYAKDNGRKVVIIYPDGSTNLSRDR